MDDVGLQFGLIEEVAAVNPDLVVRDKKGEIYTVQYDVVKAMLLNEFLKQRRKVEQQATITQLRNCKRQSHSSRSKLKRLLRAYRK